jgi:hypothetical protein
MGLFPLKIQTLLFPVSSTEDKWGKVHSFTLLFFYYLIFDLLSREEDHRHSSARVHAAPHKVEVFVFLAFLGCFEAFVFSLVWWLYRSTIYRLRNNGLIPALFRTIASRYTAVSFTLPIR